MLLAASGCVTPPHLGKDEGREAVVWQHKSLVTPPTPTTPTEAERNTERTLLEDLHEEQSQGNDLAQADTLYNLAILRRQQGDMAKAQELYQQALAIREQKQGPDHPDVAKVLNNLATLEAAQGDYDAAQPLLERALRIREAALGNGSELTAQSLNNLALLYAARGNAATAEPLYQRSLAIFEKSDAAQGGAARQAELERVLENYGALLRETGRNTEAQELEARARDLAAAASKGQPQNAPR